MSAEERPTWAKDFSASARRLSAAAVGGLAAGAAIGGIGGRLAMFALRLTSDPSLHGAKTDDGFIIGRFSGDTLFLVLLTALLGVLGALLYLWVRPWLPERSRPWITGAFAGIVGGALVIRPGGIDFARLDPLILAVALFIAIPALYGAAMSLLVERLLRPDSVLQRSRTWFIGLVPMIALGLGGAVGLIVVAGMLAFWALGRAVPGSLAVWRSATAVWIGRAGLLTLTGLALWALVQDVGQIL